jgi:PEP-CTERM motif
LHKSGSLSFQGTLGGVLAPNNNGVSVGFSSLSGVLALGSDRFDVTLSPPTPPGLGIVAAQVTVTQGARPGPPPGPRPGPPPGPEPGPGPRPGPPPGPHDSPEPSTLLLAGLGLSAVGGRAWWRRRAVAGNA